MCFVPIFLNREKKRFNVRRFPSWVFWHCDFSKKSNCPKRSSLVFFPIFLDRKAFKQKVSPFWIVSALQLFWNLLVTNRRFSLWFLEGKESKVLFFDVSRENRSKEDLHTAYPVESSRSQLYRLI